jgi:nucleoside-diphosphate-sugar epimerase
MSNTILFGGSGFFGPIILKKDPNIISVGRSAPSLNVSNKHIFIKNLDDFSNLNKLDFDKVIFLIGSSNHHEINKSQTMGIDFNVYPLKKILSFLKSKKIKKFICFTTVLLYDEQNLKFPVNEKNPINPYKNDYIFSKYLSEEVIDFYKDYIPSIIVRLSNIYGYSKLTRPDLVPTIINSILTKKSVSIWNTKPERDFIFAEDAADAVLKLLDSDFCGKVNLGTGKSHSIKEITDIIERLSNKKIISENKLVTGPMKLVIDTSLIKKIIDWQPKFSLEKGLIKTYEITKDLFNKST